MVYSQALSYVFYARLVKIEGHPPRRMGRVLDEYGGDFFRTDPSLPECFNHYGARLLLIGLRDLPVRQWPGHRDIPVEMIGVGRAPKKHALAHSAVQIHDYHVLGLHPIVGYAARFDLTYANLVIFYTYDCLLGFLIRAFPPCMGIFFISIHVKIISSVVLAAFLHAFITMRLFIASSNENIGCLL